MAGWLDGWMAMQVVLTIRRCLFVEGSTAPLPPSPPAAARLRSLPLLPPPSPPAAGAGARLRSFPLPTPPLPMFFISFPRWLSASAAAMGSIIFLACRWKTRRGNRARLSFIEINHKKEARHGQSRARDHRKRPGQRLSSSVHRGQQVRLERAAARIEPRAVRIEQRALGIGPRELGNKPRAYGLVARTRVVDACALQR